MNVFTSSGKMIALEEPPLASGGEGTVYKIVGYPKKVAKIYHNLSDAKAKEGKITEMVKISKGRSFQSTKLAQDVAWPLSPLFDAKHNFIGFGMNYIHANDELDDLYVYPPKDNANVTVVNKIACAISLCDVVERLHSQGQCFGDGNPVNLKIDHNFKVCFLDADSFQFNSNGTAYKCEVCAPGYVAPELIHKCKGTTYSKYPGETFNEYTDNFSLAIHIFRLLFNGAHPYICQRQIKRVGSAPAPKSMDKRVESGETPFFKSVPNYTTPNYAPDIKSIPPYIRDLFERSFVIAHTDPGKRPSATEWKVALQKMQGDLKQCSKNHTHYYWGGNNNCPYCDADKRYSEKMKSSMANTGNKSNCKALTPSRTVPIATPVVAATANASSSNITHGTSGFVFWAVTILTSIVSMITLGCYVLPELYYSITGEQTLAMIGVVGSCVSGFIGTLIYNIFWTSGKHQGRYVWWEYLLSILTGLGFVVGFGVAMGVIAIVLMVLFLVLVVCAGVAFLIGMFSGG